MAALLAVAVAAALFVRFVRLERSARTLGVVLWVLGVVLVDAAVWPDPNTVPAGLFHPDLGGTNFRLVDVVVLAALAARAVGRGMPTSFSVPALCWAAFLLWYAAAAVRGVLVGNDPTELVYQGKALAYLGVLCVASGVRPGEWSSRALDRFLLAAAAVSGLLLVTSQASLTSDAALPLLPLLETGALGADLATLDVSLGLLALVRALTAVRGRTTMLVAAVVLLVAPAGSGQRAALIGLATGLLVVAVLLVRGGRPVLPRGGDVVVAALVVLTLLTVPALVSTLAGGSGELPLAATLSEAIDSRGKQLSAQGRINQWREVRPLLAEAPGQGHGLGYTYEYYEPGPQEFIRSGLTHNIAGDLLLRTGLIGLVLFGAALTSTCLACAARLRRASPALLIGASAAVVAVVVAWATKGMVESLLEKYRLAVLLGIVSGLALALDPDAPAAEDSVQDRTAAPAAAHRTMGRT